MMTSKAARAAKLAKLRRSESLPHYRPAKQGHVSELDFCISGLLNSPNCPHARYKADDDDIVAKYYYKI